MYSTAIVLLMFGFTDKGMSDRTHSMQVADQKMTRLYFENVKKLDRRSQWPSCLRRESTADRLLGLWVRIPLWAWMFVCCEYCVFVR